MTKKLEISRELAPCPFCGGLPTITKHFRHEMYSFTHRCSVIGPISRDFRENPQGHIDMWNTRIAEQPAPVAVVLPDGYMIVERSIWTEEQAESAAKCITMLKNVPGMTDRDLALAAMDAGQCKAPDITLADLACLAKVKELNQ